MWATNLIFSFTKSLWLASKLIRQKSPTLFIAFGTNNACNLIIDSSDIHANIMNRQTRIFKGKPQVFIATVKKSLKMSFSTTTILSALLSQINFLGNHGLSLFCEPIETPIDVYDDERKSFAGFVVQFCKSFIHSYAC